MFNQICNVSFGGWGLLEIIPFVLIVLGALWIDLKAHKEDEPISLKNAGIWSAVWVSVSLAFAAFIGATHGAAQSSLFLSGYFLEKSLSVDNLFVFMAIFASFGIKDKFQHRILYFGILGAIVLRFIFIGFGTGLAMCSDYVLLGFGLIVLWSAYAMWKGDGAKEEVDYTKHKVVSWVTKIFRLDWLRLPFGIADGLLSKVRAQLSFEVATKVTGHDFFTKENGVRMITPLFLCLCVVELSDVMFAFDSVPAVIAITQDPFLVYSSNIFAILGLRSMYFLLTAAKKYLCQLENAVIAILVFIGGKMIAGFYGLHISPNLSLGIVLGCLALGVAASFIFPEAEETD